MDSEDSNASIRELYQKLLDSWNRRSGRDFASLVLEDGEAVGFDGSSHLGRSQIESDLTALLSRQIPAAYVGLVRTIRFLAPEVALLRAVAGMVPPGQEDIFPPVNAVQTLVVKREDEVWRIALFQNTPAAYHGRPELTQKLTEELNQALRKTSGKAETTASGSIDRPPGNQ